MMSTECMCICCLPVYLILQEQIVLPEKCFLQELQEKSTIQTAFTWQSFTQFHNSI